MCFVARKILHGTQTQCLQLMAREEGHLKVKIDSKLTTCYFLTVPSCCHIMGPPPSSVIVIARTSIVPHCHTLPHSATTELRLPRSSAKSRLCHYICYCGCLLAANMATCDMRHVARCHASQYLGQPPAGGMSPCLHVAMSTLLTGGPLHTGKT